LKGKGLEGKRELGKKSTYDLSNKRPDVVPLYKKGGSAPGTERKRQIRPSERGETLAQKGKSETRTQGTTYTGLSRLSIFPIERGRKDTAAADLEEKKKKKKKKQAHSGITD